MTPCKHLLNVLLLLAAVTVGQTAGGNSAAGSPDADGKYTIAAEGIRAQFIPYGASLTNLYVNDTNGIDRDIVLGYDNASYYSIDQSHPHLGGVPGRYANRIKNSTFEIDGIEYHVLPNEHNNNNTLHGGPRGWDWRNFTVVAHTTSSVTFSIVDPDGEQGFPGEVISYITYTVTPYQWHIKMVALATTKKTPIMLTSHVYWNLDAFQNPNNPTALNHTLHLPYSGQRIAVDGILIPNGTILANQPGSVNDFWTAPKQVGASFDDPEILGNCGTNCSGYDNCFLVNRAQEGPFDWRSKGPVATVLSTMPLKRTQGFFDDPSRPRVVEKYGCVVIEVQDWIDGISQRAWQRDRKQIFGPDSEPYVLEAVYKFSVDTADNREL